MGPVAPREAGRGSCAPKVPPQLDLDHAAAFASGPTIVRRARAADIHSLVEAAKARIPGKLADEKVVRRVWSRQPDSLWGFYQNGELVGGLAMFVLNQAGVKALLAGRLDGTDPRDEHLAGPMEAPKGIYIWAVAHSGASDGIAKLFARLQAPECPFDECVAPVRRMVEQRNAGDDRRKLVIAALRQRSVEIKSAALSRRSSSIIPRTVRVVLRSSP